MAKQQTPDFQTIQQHIAEIRKVRSDITIHAQTEALLSQLVDSIGLQDHEFEQVFASKLPNADATKKKKKVRKESNQNPLRAITAAQLSLLLARAQLDDFQTVVQAETSYQDEIKQFEKAHPTTSKLHFDFTRQLSPDLAIDFLDNLNEQSSQSKARIQELLDEHQKEVDSFMSEYNSLMQDFAEQLKQKGLAVSPTDLKHAFRLLSEITYDYAPPIQREIRI